MTRVLAVDDSRAHLALLRAFLESLPIEFVGAKSAEEALNELQRSTPFDLILLDRELPGMSGVELLRRLKNDERLRLIPVIMQTSLSAPEQIREGVEAGADYYLTKPVEPNLLNALVRGALREAEQQRQIASSAGVPSRMLRLLRDAEFEFRTLSDAQHLATELSALCPNPERSAMGLMELLVNAIEHGNLEISYQEKALLCRNNAWTEEVERRLDLPTYAARRGHLRVQCSKDRIRFQVRDDGPGFCWRDFLEFDASRALEPNGRGIALARALAFTGLVYNDPGNVVIADVDLKEPS